MSQQMDFEIDDIDVHFIENRFPIARKFDRLVQTARQLGGFDFVVVDSSAAFFLGDDENNNAQAGKHAAQLRQLTTLPGNPSVLTLCHPPKNASDDNLQPRGGGAYVAEIDGNLTVTKDDMTVTLHWQTKLRGPDFAPINFLLRQVTHERLVTKKGKLMPTIIAALLSDTAKEEMTKAARADEDLVLETLSRDPSASFTDVAKKLNWLTPKGDPYKMKIHRSVERLQREKLLAKERGRLVLTEKGKKLLKEEGK
jgi:AAA domain